ncbi:ABC transporter substrate-binding protein [Zhihengliuella halotolerans]|uniref:ABC transporter substrate-binding protein n=1 Tax=Zhihengliuella halotolerans TaxID=370736 RepID=UPI000C80AE57|nr:ABC transporter substrate-binding protein [Zhihengliuella halotolerans]
MKIRSAAWAAVAATLALTVTGCGASEPVPDSSAAGSAAEGGEGATEYPLVLDNCGVEVTVEAPPERVVSLDQNSTEILYSLGLQDRIAGTASWTDPILEEFEDVDESVPRLSDNAPSYEVVLDADPDFITASFGRHFNEEGGIATRDRFAETAIETYLSPTDCEGSTTINGGGTRTTLLEIDSLYTEIRELAAVFDVPSRGEALVADLEERTAAALDGADADGATVAFWFADTTTPYFAGAFGSPGLLAEMSGMENVFDDIPDDWTAAGWETVVERDPDVLVLGDLQRNRFPGDLLEDKIEFLESDPLTKNLDAVKNERYISLHGAEMNPSIRLVDGLEKIGDFWKEQDAD